MLAEQHPATVHGHTAGGEVSPTYACWTAMKHRCTNPNAVNWKDYGGRGIFVCRRWREGDGSKGGFECFLEDMGEKPEGLTLDRRNNSVGYGIGNCWWATPSQQAKNRRNTLSSPFKNRYRCAYL